MIDLRSDTVTQPTEAMLAAMQEATYGDDSRDGDPTVQKLEALAAEKTGKESGAYMPSGTMTNLVAMLAGWLVTEIGRQPWLVTGILRTADAVGQVSGPLLGASLTAYVITYAVMLIAYMVVLTHLAGKGAKP